ncbi:UNVERIFIED_CONTAM: hypothetical protein NY603_33810, partial [Bacteroidetes bacterium 56_B9]
FLLAGGGEDLKDFRSLQMNYAIPPTSLTARSKTKQQSSGRRHALNILKNPGSSSCLSALFLHFTSHVP